MGEPIGRRLHEAISQGLAVEDQSTWIGLRFLLALWLATIAQWPDVGQLRDAPRSLLRPPVGTAELAADFVPRDSLSLACLEVAGIVCLAAFGAGVRGAWWALGGWAVAAHSVVFAFGKVDHTYVPWLLPLVCAGSGWGATSRDASILASRAPAIMLAAVAWTTAALPKLAGGWFSPSTQTAAHLLVGREAGPLAAAFLNLPSSLLELVDWAVVLGEFAIAPLLFLAPTRVPALLGATVFHISVLLVFGIGYDAIVVLYLFLAVPSALAASAGRAVHRQRTGSAALGLLMVAGLYRMLAANDRLQLSVAGRFTDRAEFAGSLVTLVAAIGLLAWWLLRALRWTGRASAVGPSDQLDDLSAT